MTDNTKGIYPNWVSDHDIVNQILNDIIRHGGKLPYAYVVHPDQTPENSERIKRIIHFMQHEKLILQPANEFDDLEIAVEGSRAVLSGFKKYKKRKIWSLLFKRFNRVSFIFFTTVVLGGITILVLFVLHKFKVV